MLRKVRLPTTFRYGSINRPTSYLKSKWSLSNHSVRHTLLTVLPGTVYSFSQFSAAHEFSNRLSHPRTAAPQAALRWDHTPEEILKMARDLIISQGATLDKIGALMPEICSFESVFLPLAQCEAEYWCRVEPLVFYQNVSPDKALRNASREADALLRDFIVEQSMRIDVYNAKVAAQKNLKNSASWESLSHEERRLVDKMVLDGTRAGLALPEPERMELKELHKALSQVCLKFQKNYTEENGSITLTESELKGVPSDILSGYKKRTVGKETVYDVALKSQDISPVNKFAEHPDVRRRAFECYESRLAVNAPLLSEALSLRRKIALMLGYKTWADYVTEEKMVQSGEAATKFLDDLYGKVRPLAVTERKSLLAMKEKEHKDKDLFFDGQFYLSDSAYYRRKYVQATLDLDEMLVKDYFPVSVVVPYILHVYEKLFSIKFEEEEGSSWHPDVQKFAVWEHNEGRNTGFLGYCYFDLFPREFKYGHAAVWPLVSGFEREDGSRNYPVTVMVANLAKPTPEKPALMKHQDVVTFFHEMGHVFHNLLSKTTFSRFHGTSVAGDFVEVPSQLLEYWCWLPAVLKQISSHYITGEPLPDTLIEKIIKSRHMNAGLFYLTQIFYAKFDLKVHSEAPTDYTELWNKLREEITMGKVDIWCPGQGSFAHIVGGYDAGYYGYAYSLVFAADMFERGAFSAHPLDPHGGSTLRRKVLAPGGSREPLDLITDYLGRPPCNDAFVRELLAAQ